MDFASERATLGVGWSRCFSLAILLAVVAVGAQAQDKCSASGLMGGQKFTANHCAVAVYEHSVAIWFNEDPISAEEVKNFQISAYAGEKKDGKQRTQLQLMFCPGGGASTAAPGAVKRIDLNTNHAQSPLLGVQTVVEAPKGFKVEKMTGEVKPGGSLAGKIVSGASETKTTFNVEFDVKLPAKEASAGVGCGP